MNPPPDPFTLLGLPRTFALDEAEISAAYWSRLPDLHPDLSLHQDSDDLTATLNSARDLLSRPLSRAETLVKLLSPESATDASLPTGFLAFVMEARQDMQAQLEGPDAAAAAKRWGDWIEEQASIRVKRLASLLSVSPTDFKAAQMEINSLRYIERFRAALSGQRGPF